MIELDKSLQHVYAKNFLIRKCITSIRFVPYHSDGYTLMIRASKKTHYLHTFVNKMWFQSSVCVCMCVMCVQSEYVWIHLGDNSVALHANGQRR